MLYNTHRTLHCILAMLFSRSPTRSAVPVTLYAILSQHPSPYTIPPSSRYMIAQSHCIFPPTGVFAPPALQVFRTGMCSPSPCVLLSPHCFPICFVYDATVGGVACLSPTSDAIDSVLFPPHFATLATIPVSHCMWFPTSLYAAPSPSSNHQPPTSTPSTYLVLSPTIAASSCSLSPSVSAPL
uniref:Uncharacterized protein n=1 Tax=Lygus hesperus TaxID=30085 RepID=A0A146M7E0_LYGHE